jgi:hypothetical protein
MVPASVAKVLFSRHQMRRCFPRLDLISFSCVERIYASQAFIEYKIFFAIFLEVPISEEFRVFILLRISHSQRFSLCDKSFFKFLISQVLLFYELSYVFRRPDIFRACPALEE